MGRLTERQRVSGVRTNGRQCEQVVESVNRWVTEGGVGDREIMGEKERMREKERTMSAREGEQVTGVGDTEKEIMDNRKRQRQGRERGREGMPEEEKGGNRGRGTTQSGSKQGVQRAQGGGRQERSWWAGITKGEHD